MDTNLRLQLSPEEEQALFQKYDLKRDGSICYREFCDVINRSELLERMKIFLENIKSVIKMRVRVQKILDPMGSTEYLILAHLRGNGFNW